LSLLASVAFVWGWGGGRAPGGGGASSLAGCPPRALAPPPPPHPVLFADFILKSYLNFKEGIASVPL
jgi:hypothetical protein